MPLLRSFILLTLRTFTTAITIYLRSCKCFLVEQIKDEVQYQKHKGFRFGNKFIHVQELWCSFPWQVWRQVWWSPCSRHTEDNGLLWLWGCVRLHSRSREDPWRLHSTVLRWGCHKSVCHCQRPVWGLIPRRCPILIYNLRFKKKGDGREKGSAWGR